MTQTDSGLDCHLIPPPVPRWVWAVRLMALAALGISLFLLYESLAGGPHVPGCGDMGKLSCEHVLRSKWSAAFGVPVSGPAAAAYALLLAMTFRICRGSEAGRRRAWAVMILLAGAITGAAVWFSSLQLAMGKFCPYCMTAHTLGLIVSVLIITHAPVGAASPGESVRLPARWAVTLAACGLACVGFLAAGAREPHAQETQLAGDFSEAQAAKEFDQGKGKDRRIFVLTGRFKGDDGSTEHHMVGFTLRPADYPMLGSLDATHIIVELFDYTCPHCRNFHNQLPDAFKRFGNQIALVVLPMPLESKCNPRIDETDPAHVGACELARLALAVWRADPKAFAKLDAWLFAPPDPRTPKAARAYAEQILGAPRLASALADPWVEKQLKIDVGLYDRLDGGAIPKILLGRSIIDGDPNEGDPNDVRFRAVLEQDLGVKPVAAATQAASRPATEPASAP